MVDPTPVVSMPDQEYLELYNSGTVAVNLKNWILELGTKQKLLPDVTIDPSGYLLITSTGGAKELQQFGKVIEISGFGITNSGMVLSLYNPDKQLMDQLLYTPAMHQKGFTDGGYSLERIDPERFCGQSSNWVTTISSKGGTPGNENSVRAANPDQVPPQILATTFANHSRLEVQLSENAVSPAQPTELLTNIPVGVAVDSLTIDHQSNLLCIWFRSETILNGMDYSLQLHGLQDECGNVMADCSLKFGFYRPLKSDLLISEVLFNPYPEGSDFVEIFNNSIHDIDISGLFLATRDEANVLKQISPLAATQQYLPAGSFLAVTKSPEGILRFYKSKCENCLLQCEKFPTLTDLSGTVVLLNQSREVLDEMTYSDKMHDPLISGTEGISLERISMGASSFRADNWHSAAKSSGFATPGYKNSISVIADTASVSRLVSVDPTVFSPNGDGINDQLNIHLNPGNSGWILNITILNCGGNIIRNLANNVSTGSSDIVVWDGLSGDSQKVQPGIYILNISLFNLKGISRTSRIACVVTDRL